MKEEQLLPGCAVRRGVPMLFSCRMTDLILPSRPGTEAVWRGFPSRWPGKGIADAASFGICRSSPLPFP